MKIRAAVAFGFPMKIPVLDVKAHRQAHVGVGGQLFAGRAFVRRTAELKDRRIFPFDHFGAQFDFHRAAVAGAGDELPDRRRTGAEGGEAFEIQRREKTVGIDPGAEAFDKNVAVHRKIRIQIGAEDAIVFGIDAAQIHANARHAAATVGQQDEIRGRERGREQRGGCEKTNRG